MPGEMLERVAANQSLARKQDLTSTILAAAMDPSVDVAKMTALVDLKIKMDMHELELRKYDAKVEFAAAKSALQAVAPRVDQNGIVVNHKTGAVQSRYAMLEDIDLILRPLFEEHGFSIVVTNASTVGDLMRFAGTVEHRLGHSEQIGIDLPRDSQGSKNGTQGAISTLSYARRALMKAWANVIEKGTDKNGETPAGPISAQQVMTINDLIIRAGKKEKAFLIWLGYPSLEAILTKDYDKAVNALNLTIQAKENPE